MPRLLSVNVGKVRQVLWRGRAVQTGIFKEPVFGSVQVCRVGLMGDQQADLRVHGGAGKAVYAYPHEHYCHWERTLGLGSLAPGSFGENLTVRGLLEPGVSIGDTLRIGTAVFAVTQPRFPCFKLALRFNRPEIIREFQLSGRSGFYLSVLEEGVVEAPSTIVHLPGSDPQRLAIAEALTIAGLPGS